MLRLGLVGTESSHVDALLRHVAGRSDVDLVAAVPEPGARALDGVPVAATPGDLIGRVDGVALMARDARKHLALARPLLAAGVRIWVDKPLAASLEEAELLLAGGLVTSFSALRFSPEARAFHAEVAHRREGGEVTAVGAVGHADPSSPWGGARFYGVHTAELVGPWWGEEPPAARCGADGPVARAATDGLTVEARLTARDTPFSLWWEDTTGSRNTTRIPVRPDYFEPAASRLIDFLAGGPPPVMPEECRRIVGATEALVAAWQ